MSILISLCNGHPQKTGLLLASDDLSQVQRPMEPPGVFYGSTCGLAADSKWILFVKIGCIVVVSRKDFSLRSIYRFGYARDVHSILVDGERLFAVATFQNSVVELAFTDGIITGEKIIWTPTPEAMGIDQDHLNGICLRDGHILVSAFGPKVGPVWKDSIEGYIFDITSSEIIVRGLRHPHSVTVMEKRLFACESMKGSVRNFTDDRSVTLDGYARGLCLGRNGIYVGTSVGRAVSKSTGLIANPADEGSIKGSCGVHLLENSSLRVMKSLALSHETEIYDLMPLEEDGSAWPMIPV